MFEMMHERSSRHDSWIAAISFLTVPQICIASIARAQAETFEEKYGKMVTDGAANESIKLALSKIHQTKCDQSKPCEAATPAEFARPPISIQDARIAMVTGIKSALAQWCGLNALRSFLPMVAKWDAGKKSARERQLFALIHADFAGRQLATYKSAGACPASLRGQLDQQLPAL